MHKRMTQKTTTPYYPYHPRKISNHGVWEVGTLQLKVYGILAKGQEITDDLCNEARAFAEAELPNLVIAEGEDNGLGFVIIHPGDKGTSILLQWWVQGSVLCQHIKRVVRDSGEQLNMSCNPVIACVWELELINLEQRIWRNTMMMAKSDAVVYLNTRTTVFEV